MLRYELSSKDFNWKRVQESEMSCLVGTPFQYNLWMHRMLPLFLIVTKRGRVTDAFVTWNVNFVMPALFNSKIRKGKGRGSSTSI